MYALHDVFMPDTMQERLLADFDTVIARPLLSKAYTKAQNWFTNIVREVSGDTSVDLAARDAWRGYKSTAGRAYSSDAHIDMEETGSALQKYVLNVANNERTGTIFFTDYDLVITQFRSEQLFQVTHSGELAVSPLIQIEFVWEQPQNGQLSSFNMGNQLHAAAPLMEGDQKITFSAIANR
jgi:hypothetical protein